jgi:probable phosphoglycerate mutase
MLSPMTGIPTNPTELWLARHGETAWSLSGQHTGSTDIPLTDRGRAEAAALGRRLAGRRFALVLVSPLQRARETCRIAGYGYVAQTDPNLHEWSYGSIEGRTLSEVRAAHPDWSLWNDGPPGGEHLEHVAARAAALIERVRAVEGDVLLFGHGHILRILTACWLELPPRVASQFSLGTACLGVLGYERQTRAMLRWNLPASE